jgi:hypothetical protein
MKRFSALEGHINSLTVPVCHIAYDNEIPYLKVHVFIISRGNCIMLLESLVIIDASAL